jgi:hypothetical protein
MAKKKTETPQDDAADTETSSVEPGLVCGRCGKPFTDEQLEKGVECTHWRCPIN